jgi:hypothetical protein
MQNKGCPRLLSNYVLLMAPNPGHITLHLADSIIDCPSRGTSMNLPIAVLRRLDAMAEEARLVRTSRNELLAALIATTELDRAALEKVVSGYRRLLIGEVLPDKGVDAGDSVVVPMRKPGRPSASSGP